MANEDAHTKAIDLFKSDQKAKGTHYRGRTAPKRIVEYFGLLDTTEREAYVQKAKNRRLESGAAAKKAKGTPRIDGFLEDQIARAKAAEATMHKLGDVPDLDLTERYSSPEREDIRSEQGSSTSVAASDDEAAGSHDGPPAQAQPRLTAESQQWTVERASMFQGISKMEATRMPPVVARLAREGTEADLALGLDASAQYPQSASSSATVTDGWHGHLADAGTTIASSDRGPSDSQQYPMFASRLLGQPAAQRFQTEQSPSVGITNWGNQGVSQMSVPALNGGGSPHTQGGAPFQLGAHYGEHLAAHMRHR